MSIASSPLRDRMIFVVGARRSGTNWIGRIIMSHPDVDGVRSESYLFSLGLSPLTRRFQHATKGSWQIGSIYVERPVLLDALRDFCDAVFGSVLAHSVKGATRLLERTPHHSRELPLIGAVYPDAHVVHIVRDARAVVRSLLKMRWGPESVEEAVTEWRDSVTAARRDGAALERYHEVRYEDLMGDVRALVVDLFTALDLEVSDEIVDRAVIEAAEEFNVDQSTPGVSVSKWQGALTDVQLEMIERIAGPLLRELGYEHTAPALAASAATSTSTSTSTRSVATAARATVRRARGVAGRVRRRDAPPSGPSHPILLQEIVDRFISAVREGRRADAASLLLPVLRVRVVASGEHWDERSATAGERLLDVLFADPAFGGAQVLCDIWPSPPVFTVVLTAETADTVLHRTLWFRVVATGINLAAYYAFD